MLPPASSQAPLTTCRHRPAFSQRLPPCRSSRVVALSPRRAAGANSSSLSTPAAAAAASAQPQPQAPPPPPACSPSASWSGTCWPDWQPHPNPSSRPTVALLDLRMLGPIPYEAGWDLQRRLVDALLAERQRPEPSSSPRRPAGALILLQHEPVYTLGAGATTANLRFDPGRAFFEGEEGEAATAASSSSFSSFSSHLPPPPAPLHRVERGGEVTWHGPGQLVLYPILDLRAGEEENDGDGAGGNETKVVAPFLTDLHWYLRALEEVVMRALARLPSHPLLLKNNLPLPPPLLEAKREPGLTGVWLGGAKAAALGVRASRWATYHGLALNVNPDLSFFDHIVPCGIVGREVASVVTAWEREVRGSREGKEDGDGEFALPASWKESPGEGPLIAAAGDALLAAFCDVLGARLESVGEIPRDLLLPSLGLQGADESEAAMVSFAERVIRGEMNEKL